MGSGRTGSAPGGTRTPDPLLGRQLRLSHKRTGARLIVGHSYGGLVVLEAARSSRVFAQIAVYEPGVSIGASLAISGQARPPTKG